MSSDAPSGSPEARSDPGGRERSWAVDAVRRGFLAFLAISLVGQVIGFAEWLVMSRPFGLRLPVKLGWVYLCSFHRIGIDIRFEGPPVLGLVTPSSAGYVYRLHVAFLLGTALAIWLLFRAGRAVAERSTGRPLERALRGAAVAPAYALPVFLVSLVVTLRFPDAGVPSVHPVAWEALVYPFLLAGVAGGLGGLAGAWDAIAERAPWGPRALAWASGGWRMLIVSLVLAFVGVLGLAAVRPDASGAYARWLVRGGRTGALVFTHHLLALPNQSTAVVVAAMGGCQGIYGSASSRDLLCYGRLVNADYLVYAPLAATEELPDPTRTAGAPGSTPAVWLVFLLVPLVSTALGGREAARGELPPREASFRAAGAGIVFALLLGLGARIAGLDLGIPASGASPGGTVFLGPDVGTAFALALLWGVLGGTGGALGSWLLRPDARAPRAATTRDRTRGP